MPSKACPIDFEVKGAIDTSQGKARHNSDHSGIQSLRRSLLSRLTRKEDGQTDLEIETVINCPDTLPSTIVTKESKWHLKPSMRRAKEAVTNNSSYVLTINELTVLHWAVVW